MNKRAVILTTAIVFGFFLISLRLAELMLFNHKRLAERATSQYSGEKAVRVYRGWIYDRRGRELAVNRDMLSAYCRPGEIDSPAEFAKAVSKIAHKDYKSVKKVIESDRGFAWIERKLPEDTAQKLEGLKLKGLGLVPEVQRVYPKSTLASHVLGFVGVDNQALGGIELKYDEYLRGKEERVSYSRDAAGRKLSDGMEFESTGGSLVLTIDEGLQYILEKELDAAMEKWSSSSISAIMMDPYTGEILAMANRPTYDSNRPTAFRTEQRRNRCITDSYEPGSTFKLITAMAAFEEKLIKPTTEFDCSKGFISVGRRTIWDTHKNGVLTFREVIQKSSNVGAVQAAQIIGKDKIYEYAKRLGFGEKTGIDLPGESRGVVRPLKEWSDVTLSSTSIGYGVGVTPVQVLRAYSAVANGGLLVTPHLVREIVLPNGGRIKSAAAEGKGAFERVMSKSTAEKLKEILVLVTNEDGTAYEASIDGNIVAGKTGTARLLDPETGKYSTDRYASSFVGFVPADRPRIALIVVVFEPKEQFYGGLVAAPVFKNIAGKSLAYLNVPREDSFGDNLLVVQRKGGG